MDPNWYYVDRNGQQVGPMAAGALRAALQSGNASLQTLAWREGLQEWAPIASFANELGLDAASTPPEVDPYRAPHTLSRDRDEFVAGTDVVYAGFWRRWAAVFLDQLIISIPLSFLFGIAGAMIGFGAASSGGQPDIALVTALQIGYYVIYFGVGFLYFAWQESSDAQATLGKRALGIKVTDGEGRRISFGRAAGRYFAAALSAMSLYIGYAMAGFTERKRALHDMVADTLVVDRWAYTDSPERQQRQMSGCLIAFIVIIVLMVLAFFAVFAVMGAVLFQQFQQHKL